MKLHIKQTKTGKGVFAGERIAKGALIIKMSGQRLPWRKVEPLVLSGTLSVDDPFQVGEDMFVVLDPEPRYFNHRCDPNAGVGKGEVLFALRDIEKGEEITFDYSSVVCVHCDWCMQCACDYFLCRGVVKHARSVPKARLQKYAKVGALPQFIKKELSL